MDFGLSPHEERFRDELRAWLAANLPEHRKVYPPSDDELSFHPDASFDACCVWHKRLHPGGWMGVAWPCEYGGRPILAADEIWCQGFSEPGAGSDLANLATRARLEGDGFTVSGQKVWTSNAHRSDYCLLLARTDPDAPRHKGISCLLVDMKSPGITIRPLVQLTGDAEFNEVFFDEVRVPRADLLGRLHGGWEVAITILMWKR